jgi:hypothetical protein
MHMNIVSLSSGRVPDFSSKENLAVAYKLVCFESETFTIKQKSVQALFQLEIAMQ